MVFVVVLVVVVMVVVAQWWYGPGQRKPHTTEGGTIHDRFGLNLVGVAGVVEVGVVVGVRVDFLAVKQCHSCCNY